MESHQTPETESPSRPYQSDFPVESPLNESQRTSVFIKRRTSFLQSFKPKANEKSEATESDSDDDKETQEIKEDPDVGYAELGGFTSELRTGMLDEPPIKLHPTRFFYAGEQYEPEVLLFMIYMILDCRNCIRMELLKSEEFQEGVRAI